MILLMIYQLDQERITLNHFIERVKIYVQEQFNYEITSVNIKD